MCFSKSQRVKWEKTKKTQFVEEIKIANRISKDDHFTYKKITKLQWRFLKFILLLVKKKPTMKFYFSVIILLSKFFFNVRITSVRQSYEQTGTPTHCLACEMTVFLKVKLSDLTKCKMCLYFHLPILFFKIKTECS